MKDILKRRARLFRGTPSRGLGRGGRVIRDGGDSKAGLIVAASVTTRGEAIGHGMWLDNEFLGSVAEAINSQGDQGIKSRFTHPSMSGDGLGRFLGRIKDGRVSGDQVLADDLGQRGRQQLGRQHDPQASPVASA